MHILISGGTGLIGRALCKYWLAQNHTLTVWSRRPQLVASLYGQQVRGVASLEQMFEEPLDAIINLAGAPIADWWWTTHRKRLLRNSRIGVTEQFVDWLTSRRQRPKLFISGSAVGYYGDGKDCFLNEFSPPERNNFASELCHAWETTAQRVESLDVRVVRLRTGLVLAADGGFLKRLRLPFRCGLGGPLGDGNHWMSWIHLEDQVRLIDFLLHLPNAQGAYNACSPVPVRNIDFMRALGRTLQRPTLFRLPSVLLRTLFGELAELLLSSQRVIPARLQEAGYAFLFNDLDKAFCDLLQPTHTNSTTI